MAYFGLYVIGNMQYENPSYLDVLVVVQVLP